MGRGLQKSGRFVEHIAKPLAITLAVFYDPKECRRMTFARVKIIAALILFPTRCHSVGTKNVGTSSAVRG